MRIFCATEMQLGDEACQNLRQAIEKMDLKLNEATAPVLLEAVRECVDNVLLCLVELKFEVKLESKDSAAVASE